MAMYSEERANGYLADKASDLYSLSMSKMLLGEKMTVM